MATQKNTVQITFRAPAEVVAQLDELCEMVGWKRSEFFINTIVAQYEQVHGFPEFKNIIEHLRGIGEAFDRMPRVVQSADETTLSRKGGDGEA